MKMKKKTMKVSAKEARRLVAKLNAARKLCPQPSDSEGKTSEQALADTREWIKDFDEWEKRDFNPHRQALKDAGVEVKWNFWSGKYTLKYNEDGKEMFMVRVTQKRHIDLLIPADSASEAINIAFQTADFSGGKAGKSALSAQVG